jgi:hypothetical protein
MISKTKGQSPTSKNKEFGLYYQYLVNERKMERMKAITKLCCKLVRVIFGLCKKGEYYDKRKVFARGVPFYDKLAA